MNVRVWIVPLLIVVAVGAAALYYSRTPASEVRQVGGETVAAVAPLGAVVSSRRAPAGSMLVASPITRPESEGEQVTSAGSDLGPAQASPDGAYVAYRGLDVTHTGLWIAPTSDPGLAEAVTTEEVGTVLDFQWTADSKHVLYSVDADENGKREVRAVDVVSGSDAAVYDLPDSDASVVKVSPKRPNEVMVAVSSDERPYQDLYRVDLATGKRTLAYRNDGYSGFVVDDDLNVRLGVSEGRNGYRIVSDLYEARADEEPVGAQQPS